MNRQAATAGLLGALVLVAGCGGRVVSAGDVTVLVSARTGAGMDALGSGRLSVVGGCLGLGDVVVVWPHGTDVVGEEPLRVEVPGVGSVGLGDQVEVGGGFVVEHEPGTPRDAGPVEVGGVSVPASCAKHDVFLAH
ncbi:MAG TPA: hypothetical protein VFV40_00815 [Nocardioides sp.]|nr:hypothetical protein [Nocardioides sp.]